MLMGSKVPPYQLDILRPKQSDISPIQRQLYKLIAAAHNQLIPGFTFAWRHNPLQPVCRELNSDPFAFLKNHSSTSRTNSSHFLSHGIFLKLAKPPVLDVSDTFKIIRTYQKIYFKKWPFLYCFRKTPSKLAFFFRKMSKYDLKISKTFLRNCKSYQVKQIFKKHVFSWLLTCPRAYTPPPSLARLSFSHFAPLPSPPLFTNNAWQVNTKQP